MVKVAVIGHQNRTGKRGSLRAFRGRRLAIGLKIDMLLLDPCAFIWLADGGKEFSPTVRRALRTQAHALQVSAISAFEIVVLHRKGRIELPEPPDRWYADIVKHHHLNEIPVTGRIAAQAALLPLIHNDPCDRMILATALAGNLHIVTADQTMPDYPGITVISTHRDHDPPLAISSPG